ncbi:hypothetical protein A2V61_00725 [Candidatus Woesebacteria bacterium RBG_19FT_COMBO_47_8]|nr:MAG: hypothetical protein A2V61_00725 [Candidatus Woesebacteria bacterium RBG_19FT_COMBO_47_8]
MPSTNPGLIISSTICARAASKSKSSVLILILLKLLSFKISLIFSPTSVPPGSRKNLTGSPSFCKYR